MNIIDLIECENENTSLDFKKTQYMKPNYESLLKDVMSMANAITKNNRLIIIGVKHYPDGKRDLLGINDDFVDDATYQQLIDANIEPKIIFEYYPFKYKDKLFGIFHIKECSNPPYMMKKTYGKLEIGDSYIRKGSFQKRMTRSDIDDQLDSRIDMDISNDIFVSLSDKEVVKESVLQREEIDLPSDVMKREIDSIIKKKEVQELNKDSLQELFKINSTPLNIYKFTPYEDRDIDTLKRNLKTVEDDYKEEDEYYIFERNAMKLNFYILNHSSNFLENASVEIIFPTSENYVIAEYVYAKSVSYYPLIPNIPAQTPSFDELNYPTVEIKEGIYRVYSEIGDVKHQLHSSVFDVPLRFIPLNYKEGFNVNILVKVYAKDLKKPIEETLRLEIK